MTAGPDAPGVVVGLVLAAGAGRRFGRPKALVQGWVGDRCTALRTGGCDRVVVVLGAAAEEARALVPEGVDVVVAAGWADGQSASLRAGLGARAMTAADAALVVLVDTPGLTGTAVARVLAAARDGGRAATAHALVQATYDGEPGHPVVLGRAHWPPVLAEARGDRGARDVLARGPVRRVPCEDVADGRDVDVEGDAARVGIDPTVGGDRVGASTDADRILDTDRTRRAPAGPTPEEDA
nr:NTP transferase domain-containing protein [uncultured Actinotalea sp.]